VSGQEIDPPAHPGCNEVTLADFQYQFNAVGNITQMTDGFRLGEKSHPWACDGLHQAKVLAQI
jgi:hypothetical protein